MVGEPTGWSVREEEGRKFETWSPRQTGGTRIGDAAGVTMIGNPMELRLEDGVPVGLVTPSSGGISLDRPGAGSAIGGSR